MLNIEEALKLVAQHAAPVAPRRVPLEEAVGLVLANDVISQWNSPPYSKSMMDGYAVVSSDREHVRRVIEEVAAGAVPKCAVVPGTATRIMTGAPIPDGADSVIPVEKSELIDDTHVRFDDVDIKLGQHILPLGAAIRTGDAVIRAGATIRPIELAILAEIGHAIVVAHPRSRVAVLPTGNELVGVSETPAGGQIRNTNGPMLLAAIAQAGADALDLGIGRDEPGDLRRRIEQGFTADILLLSGGVSAGKFDLVPEVLHALGVEQIFHKVALRPGKPIWFGVKHHSNRRTLVFGLPGNPVSSFVCFELFVRPAMAALAGQSFANPSTITARLRHAYDHAGGRAACLPARVTIGKDEKSPHVFAPQEHLPRFAGHDGATVEILRWQGSADLAALAKANGLVRLPTDPVHLLAGTPMDVLLI